MSHEAESDHRPDPSGHRTGLDTLRGCSALRGPVDDHDHGNDHLALLYDDPDEQLAAAAAFLEAGLERGERCLYVADDNDEADVEAALRAHGVDVDAAREDGALSVHSPAETYRQTGKFDRDAMLAFWEDALDEATEDEGFAGIRAAAEMTWALEDATSAETLVEYEAVLNDLYEGEEYAVCCQYNTERFPAAVLRDVVRTHPYVIEGDVVHDNVYYEPPEEFFAPESPESELERMVDGLRERTRAKAELQEHEQYLRELYEVTADGDRSFEETVERLLELGCERFDLRGGALSCLPSREGDFVAEVTFGPELPDEAGPFPTQPSQGCFCRQAVASEEPTAATDVVEVGWEDDPIYREFGFESYLGIQVSAGAEPYGTLWFYDTSPREGSFTDDERTFLELMAQWVSNELARERREVELQRAKDHFEQIFENSHDAIMLVDPDADELLETNPAACEMLGYDRVELLSVGPSDLHPDEMEAFREFVDTVFDQGVGWTDELSCRSKSGERIAVEISASTVEVDDRECMLAIIRDVSDRKRRQESLRRLYEIAADTDRNFEEKLQALFDLGCEQFDLDVGGLARVDPDADRFEVEATSIEHDDLAPGEVYPLSQTYCRETVGDGDVACVPEPDLEVYEDRLCYEQFGVQTYFGTYLEVEGAEDRTFWFVSGEPREQSFTEAECTFLHLMGEWVKYELERQQREVDLEETVHQLKQSNDRLTQFAYAASHDLQEPLRMISSYLQLLEREYADDLDEAAREYVEFAIDGADRMRSMVEDLLAYSRIEQREDEYALVDCDALADRVTDDLQVQIEERDATLEVDELPTVEADPEQVEQLFRNLVSNAVKYGGESPTVEIRATDRGDHWAIAVADDGIGIDPEKTDRIFEVFKRLHHEDEYSGTGIGLALCQEIVERHGGEIRVDSEPGEGSTFTIALPKRQDR